MLQICELLAGFLLEADPNSETNKHHHVLLMHAIIVPGGRTSSSFVHVVTVTVHDWVFEMERTIMTTPES